MKSRRVLTINSIYIHIKGLEVFWNLGIDARMLLE
jgi:hypothetical protein